MKQKYINELKVEDEILDFFMIKDISIKIGANKKPYLDLVLTDKTGDISGKKWDISEPEQEVINQIQKADIVRIKASVTEWNGMRQVKVMKIRAIVETDEVETTDYIKAAPEKTTDMYEYIFSKTQEMTDLDLKAICERLLIENKEKLMYYPAAAKNHHAELGGLLYHMKRMLMSAEALCKIYTNLNKDLLGAGVILHDMEKMTEIISNNLGIAEGYSFEGQMLGHLIQGVKVIDRICKELGVPEEKAIMIEHMILSHHYHPEFGSPKKPLFPEAEMLHYLDMMDAKMYDMHEALESTAPGDFSDKVWTLDNRKIYKAEEGTF